jgi:toxin ParE1/3/4
MAEYRLTHTARADIVSILAWSNEQFGPEARKRYEALIATAIRDAASRSADGGHTLRPELGEGVFTWHLSRSRARAPGDRVHRPRHFLVCRPDGDTLVIGRVLHDAMDLRQHVDPRRTWDQ